MNARTADIPDDQTRSSEAPAPGTSATRARPTEATPTGARPTLATPTGARPTLATPAGATPAAPPRSRKRRVLAALAALALLGGAAGGGWYWQVGRFLVETDNAYVGGDIAVLSPRIEGDVARILVADNAPVEAGQPLIELERRDWQARRDQAAAALAEAAANIGTLSAQRAQALAQLASAEAQVANAEAQAATAEAERVRAVAEAGRAGSLASGGYGTRAAVDATVAAQRKAEAGVAAARAGLASARAGVEAARAAIPVLEAQARSAEARRDAAHAALELAESSLEHTVIRAPQAGVAGNRAAQLGQHVRAGQNLIAVSPPAARLYVTANFKETQLRRMREGQPVELTVDAGGALHGTVESLAPATGAQFSLLPPENATGNFTKIVQRVPVRIALAPGQDVSRLRPGLSVEAEVDTRDDPHAPRGLVGSLLGAAAAIRR